MNWNPNRKKPFYYMVYVKDNLDPLIYTSTFGIVKRIKGRLCCKPLYFIPNEEKHWRASTHEKFNDAFCPNFYTGTYTFYETVKEWLQDNIIDML